MPPGLDLELAGTCSTCARQGHSHAHDSLRIRLDPEEIMRPLSKVAPTGGTTRRWTATILDDAARLTPDDLLALVAAGFQGRLLRHARGLLPGRGAGVHHGLAAGDAGRAGRHLRADRADRAAAAGGPAGQRAGARPARTPTSGAWTSGSSTARRCPVDHPLCFRRADMELCFNRIRPELRMPEANLHFPAADSGGVQRELERASAAWSCRAGRAR